MVLLSPTKENILIHILACSNSFSFNTLVVNIESYWVVQCNCIHTFPPIILINSRGNFKGYINEYILREVRGYTWSTSCLKGAFQIEE